MQKYTHKYLKVAEKPCENDIDQVMYSQEILEDLENIECARVLVDTLHLTSLMHEDDVNIVTTGKRKSKTSVGKERKPPFVSPRKKQGFVNFVIKFKLIFKK